MADTLERDDCLWPTWPAGVSRRVRALSTTRNGGVSTGAYRGADGRGGLNLGLHTGDTPEFVLENRRRVVALTGAPAAWLDQVHGALIQDAGAVIEACAQSPSTTFQADAAVTDRQGAVCVVMVADCLPVLFCDEAGHAVGAAHAGWRGLAAGIVEKTAQRVAELGHSPLEEIHAWLGPAIGPDAFEVGEDVLDAFTSAASEGQRDAIKAAFTPRHIKEKYLANIYRLARLRLAAAGVQAQNIHGGDFCTVTDARRFYSYRRDKATGRMASMIWLQE